MGRTDQAANGRWLGRAAFLAAGAVWLCGCAGYHLGPTGGVVAGSRTVQFVPFENKTKEPRLIDALSVSLRQRLQEDGTYRLETRGTGDIIVHGEITKFDRGALAFQPQSTLTVQDFTLTMTAHVTATERFGGKTNLDTTVTGATVIRVGSDQTSAERQAVPLMADDLARKVVVLLSERPW
jgi:hypothetical protein